MKETLGSESLEIFLLLGVILVQVTRSEVQYHHFSPRNRYSQYATTCASKKVQGEVGEVLSGGLAMVVTMWIGLVHILFSPKG